MSPKTCENKPQNATPSRLCLRNVVIGGSTLAVLATGNLGQAAPLSENSVEIATAAEPTGDSVAPTFVERSPSGKETENISVSPPPGFISGITIDEPESPGAACPRAPQTLRGGGTRGRGGDRGGGRGRVRRNFPRWDSEEEEGEEERVTDTRSAQLSRGGTPRGRGSGRGGRGRGRGG